MSEKKYRSFCFTWNNYTDNSLEIVEKLMKDVQYGIYGKEVGEVKGTPHLQGYLYFKNARSFESIRKKMKGAHVSIAKGTPEDNKKYCSKDYAFVEYGKIPQQGERKDLKEIAEEIMNGDKTVDMITLEDPMTYHIYGRTLNRIEDLKMRNIHREEMTKGIWYYGKTGTGKSHKAFEGYNANSHYLVPNDAGWWDGYTQQSTVIFNDFRGEVSYNMMLQLVDKWPMHVKRRNREPMPFISDLVIVTSSLSPAQLFKNREKEDDIEQLLRRFEVINLDTEVVEGNNNLHLCAILGKMSTSS